MAQSSGGSRGSFDPSMRCTRVECQPIDVRQTFPETLLRPRASNRYVVVSLPALSCRSISTFDLERMCVSQDKASLHKHYLLVSDFDQTLSFHDSGVVLSEMLGIAGFHEKIA